MAASASAALRSSSQHLVSCNVYISAGRSQHANLLTSALVQGQKLCQSLRGIKTVDENVAIVHAFADGAYNRSSFHLAGSADHVATVASQVAKEAVKGLLDLNSRDNDPENFRHPYVGLVDHVAVMPLVTEIDSENKHSHDETDEVESGSFVSLSASGSAARRIGNDLANLGVTVHFYGDADENGAPLARVRRERTSFFKSGGLRNHDGLEETTDLLGSATVGAPPTFVENWNVRLTSNCSKEMAHSLTRTLRERNGGLLGVEALTLPYSNGRYEIACNLLRPDVGSSDAIQAKVDEWVSSNIKEMPQFDHKDQLVERGYRVGTTAEQCLDVLSRPTDMDAIDKEVMDRFKEYLSAT